MPNYTPNYNLTKPLQTESYNIDVFNANADIIDTQIAANALNGPKVDQILQDTTDIKATLPTIGKTPRRQLFLDNGTWVAPAGVTRIFITGGGGGGGGSAIYSASVISDGGSGGVTSFGSLLSLTGGGGGKGTSLSSMYIAPGDSGGFGGQPGGIIYGDKFLTQGGNSGPHSGVQSILSNVAENTTLKESDYCSGGGGITYSTTLVAGGGGGAMYVQNREVEVVPGTSYNIVIGKGGIGGTANIGSSGEIKKASDGGDGYLIVEWWE